MSALVAIIAGAAAKVGAELVGKAVGGIFGPAGGQLAESVVTSVAEKLGVEPEALPSVPAGELGEAVLSVEADMPEKIALWAKGLEGQFGLQLAENKEGAFERRWRPGWMYLLGFMWAMRLMVLPIVDAIARTDICSAIDLTVLMTLTSWFIALYMGGHTLKDLGSKAIDAYAARRPAS